MRGEGTTMPRTRDSSCDSYYSVIAPDTEKKQRIMDFVKLATKGTTRRQISKALALDTATVSGLVTPMVDKDELFQSALRQPCPVTGRMVHWLHHPENMRGQKPLV